MNKEEINKNNHEITAKDIKEVKNKDNHEGLGKMITSYIVFIFVLLWFIYSA